MEYNENEPLSKAVRMFSAFDCAFHKPVDPAKREFNVPAEE
jgi:hypothetical protein